MDKMINLLEAYRRSINPPYQRKDFLTIIGTIFILITIPVVAFLLSQKTSYRSSAKSVDAAFLPASSLLPTPPSNDQALFAYMQTNLDEFEATISALPTTSYPVTMAVDLLPANGNAGQTLLVTSPKCADTSNTPSPHQFVVMCTIIPFLDQAKQMGVQAITVDIKYPLLSTTIEQNSATYLQFYQEVADDVRARGMKLGIEENAIYSGTVYSGYTYTLPDFCTYEDQVHTISQTIIDTMHPDYLQVAQEPDTQYQLTKYEEFNPANASVGGTLGYTRFVQYVLGDSNDPNCPNTHTTTLNKGTTLVAAGTGTWLPVDRTCAYTDKTCVNGNYTQSLSAISNLDAIDMHVLPTVNEPPYQYLQNIVTMADTAHGAGKRVTMTQTWASKEQSSDLSILSVANSNDIFKRDVFSYWIPVDQQFLYDIYQVAKLKNIEFVSPYWSWYLFGYLDYQPGVYDDTSSYYTLSTASQNLATANLKAGIISPTGDYLKKLLSGTYGPQNGTMSAQPIANPITSGNIFTVPIMIDGGGRAFNAASAAITLSGPLTLQNITPGDCNFTYTVNPSVTNASFDGTITGGQTMACTAFSLVLQANSGGVGIVNLSNGTIKAAANGANLLRQLSSGSYIINGPTPTLSPTNLPTPLPTSPPTSTPTPTRIPTPTSTPVPTIVSTVCTAAPTANQVIVHTGTRSSGQCYALTAGSYTTDGKGNPIAPWPSTLKNDAINSVWTGSNVSITLYANYNYTGTNELIPANTNLGTLTSVGDLKNYNILKNILQGIGNNQTSSFVIR